MNIQIGTVDGLVNIFKENIRCFVNAIYEFSNGGIQYSKENNVSLGTAFQRFVEPVYNGNQHEFKLPDIKKAVFTKGGNEQSPARCTFCKKMGLLKIDEKNDVFELTPLAKELYDNSINIEEYAFILLTKQGVFKNKEYVKNLLVYIIEWFNDNKNNKALTAKDLQNYICNFFKSNERISVEKTRLDIILNALETCGLIKDIGSKKYVLSNSKTVDLFHDFYKNRQNVSASYIDSDADYAEYIGSMNYGIFDILDASNILIYTQKFPNLIKYMNSPLPFSISKVIKDIESTGLLYDSTLVKRFAFSLMSKRFLILSGLAGSGKTQLALAFASALIKNETQMCVVPVGADWTNREPLFGFPNALVEGKYVKPESGVLDLLIEANKKENKDKPYFLILDEMNMSYVERYFADFLSAMESHKAIPLWNGEDENEAPRSISLPKNLFIIGTINVDETTYMFSPKVLDRANVIEFKISDEEMDSFLNYMKPIDRNNIKRKGACMGASFVELAGKEELADDGAIKETLSTFFRNLKSVNAEFGYRSATEIYRFVWQAQNNDDCAGDKKMTMDEILDCAIVQKLLPKLHGSRKKLEPVLQALWKECFDKENKDLVMSRDNVQKAKYPLTADKIQRMHDAAQINGFTSFAEA